MGLLFARQLVRADWNLLRRDAMVYITGDVQAIGDLILSACGDGILLYPIVVARRSAAKQAIDVIDTFLAHRPLLLLAPEHWTYVLPKDQQERLRTAETKYAFACSQDPYGFHNRAGTPATTPPVTPPRATTKRKRKAS